MSFRRDRPPSAGHVRTDSRGNMIGGGNGGSGRNQFAHMAFEPSGNNNGNLYQQHTDFAMGQSSQQPAFTRPASYGSSTISVSTNSAGGVKLPAAVNYSPPAPSNDGVIELRSALTREIDYRRQLEGEVASLKDTVASLVKSQRRQREQHEYDEEEADLTSTIVSPPAKHQRRPRSGRNRPHPPQPPNPAATPAAPATPITLNPVLPVSSKVLELEEKFNEEQQEASSRHSTISHQLHSFETSLSDLRTNQVDLRVTLLSEMEQRFVQLRHEFETERKDRNDDIDQRLSSLELRLSTDVPSTSKLTSLETRLTSSLQDCETRLTKVQEGRAETLEQTMNMLKVLEREMNEMKKNMTLMMNDKKLKEGDVLKTQVVKDMVMKLEQHDTHLTSLKSMNPLIRFETLTKTCDTLTSRLNDVTNRRELETAAHSAISKDLVERCERLRKENDGRDVKFEQYQTNQNIRLKHIEEAIRSLPNIDPTTIMSKINQLYVQVDRLETSLEVVQKKTSGKTTTQVIHAKPQTPSPKEIEAEENMRAIRAAIGTVDTKITESNVLNTQLHERMNSLDTTQGGMKKMIQDCMTRLKTLQVQTKELQESYEKFGQLEIRFQKFENDTRLREQKRKQQEKEREEKEKEKGDATTAASSTSVVGSNLNLGGTSSNIPIVTPSSGGGDPVDPASMIPDHVKTYLHDQLKRERGKLKVSMKQFELQQHETSIRLSELGTLFEGLEQKINKRHANEEKKQRDEWKKACDETSKMYETHVTDFQRKLDEVSNLSKVYSEQFEIRLKEELLQSCDQKIETLKMESNEKIETLTQQLNTLREDTLPSHLQRLNVLDERLTTTLVSSSKDVETLKKDVEMSLLKHVQTWSIVTECNRELDTIKGTMLTNVRSELEQSSETILRPLKEKLEDYEIRLIQVMKSIETIRQAPTPAPSPPPSVSIPIELTQFSNSVSELRLRHEQFSREVDMIEIKLAEQMAQIEYANQNLTLLANKCQVELPSRKTIGGGGGGKR